MHSPFAAILTLSMAAGVAAAQGTPTTASHAVVLRPDQLTWAPAPAVLPVGAKLAILEGNPNEAGPFTMRLLVPDQYRIPPHYHRMTEHVTVVKGTLRVGMGDKVDRAAMIPLPAGTFAALEPGARHYVEARGETILQLHGSGPWGLVYVNQADDPRGRTP